MKLAHKNPGVTFVVLRASNGEVCIMDEAQTSWGKDELQRPSHIMSAISNSDKGTEVQKIIDKYAD
jgi:hypothetical protein